MQAANAKTQVRGSRLSGLYDFEHIMSVFNPDFGWQLGHLKGVVAALKLLPERQPTAIIVPIHIVLGHAERKGVDPKASSGRGRRSTRQPIQLVNQRVGHRIASTGNTVPVDQQL